MRRNPYFQILLALSVMQAGYKTAFAQQITNKVSSNSQIPSVYTEAEEPSVTQFNIVGRHARLDGEGSENLPHIISSPANYSTDSNANNYNEYQQSPSSSSDSEDINSPSAAASSLLPTNFSSPHTANKPYKKPKVVLPLSLRSKESGDPNTRNNVNKYKSSPFLFGNNIIKFDTRTNRLIIPTTTEELEVSESEDDSSEAGGESDSEELGGATVISVITEGPLLDVQNQTLTALKILENLRGLTSSKLRVPPKTTFKQKGPVKQEPLYGFRRYDTLHPRLNALREGSTGTTGSRQDEQAQASTQVATKSVTDDTVVEYTTLTSKVGGHIKQNASKFHIDTPMSNSRAASSGPFTPYYSSTPPIVLKVGKLAVNSRFQNSTIEAASARPIKFSSQPADSITSSSEIDSSTVNSQEQIKTGETRVAVTADQIGGNRPTQRPFHFGPTTQPPPTTTIVTNIRANHHPIGKSPHNHAYSPTQDPVADVHNEDLSVEDFQDFRRAHAVFGSKVGANVPTLAPRTVVPRPPPVSPGLNRGRYSNEVDSDEDADDDVYYDDERPSLPVRLLQENVKKKPQVIIRTTLPTTTTTTTTTKRPVFIPERRRPGSTAGIGRTPQLQASTGVKDSQLPLQNDNLPFYKEPGGVFKEHQSNNHLNTFSSAGLDLGDDDDSNFISHDTFNENRPKVKYAPKAPSAHSEPQTVYANHINSKNNRHASNRIYNPSAQQQQQQQQPQQQQIHHLHNPQPQYIPVTQAPIFLHQQPLMHHHQQFAVIPSPTPQVVVSPLHQRPQQQPIYYHPQQPLLVPTQPLYQQTGPAAGFVPILHPQQAYAAAPVQPQYHLQNQFHQNQNSQRGGDDDFPNRNDPHSDTFFGDPTPDTDSSPPNNKKNRGGSNNQKRKNNNIKTQHNDYHGNEDRSYQNQRGQYPPPPAPPDQQQRRYPVAQLAPLRGREPNDKSRERFSNNRDDDDDDAPRKNPEYDDSRERNKGKSNRNSPDAGRRRIDNNADYDPEAESGIKDRDDDDYGEPNFDNPRPVFDDAAGPNYPTGSGDKARDHDRDRSRGHDRDRNGGYDRERDGERVRDRNREHDIDRDREGRDFPLNDKPFRPSPQDFGPIKPSAQDFPGPQFDHPNLQYPQQGRDQGRRQNFEDGPEYDPRGFGVGHGPPPANNVQLDPIYTRTIKQFDEENRKNKEPPREAEEPARRHNSHRPSGRRREQYENEDEEDGRRLPPRRNNDEEEEEEEDNRRRPPPRRNNDEEDDEEPRRQEQRQRPTQDDDEEEEEEEAPRRREPRPKQEEEEEEEEEESRNPQPKTASNNDDEEEEEEEEEEQEKPPRNRQRNPGKNKPKTRPKKPPPNEKAGSLDDDIREINREFGGIAYEQSNQPVILKTPSGVAIAPTAGASVNQPTFNFNHHQQSQPLLKSPSSPKQAKEVIPKQVKEVIPDLKIDLPNVSNITSFNVHLFENHNAKHDEISGKLNTTEASSLKSKIIVDI